MNLTIHRGAREIGGSCVELEHNGFRLLLDLGLPLVGPSGEPFALDVRRLSRQRLLELGVLPAVPGLYDGTANPNVALILSHAHQDHYGLAGFVHPSIPVYGTAGTKSLIELSMTFLPRPAWLGPIQTLPRCGCVEIGPFRVTPIAVDHSAPDAVALLVEADGKRVFYTGDLRAHGRKGALFDRLLRNPPARVDALLMEGTTLGRPSGVQVSETDVENQFVEVLKQQTNAALLVCSSQNIDRLVSAYRAVLRTRKTLVIDLYTAYVLHSLSHLSNRLPQANWDRIRVKYWSAHAKKLAAAGQVKFLYRFRRQKIEMNEIVAQRRDILMLVKSGSLFQILMRHIGDVKGLEILWSMWGGYWEQDTFLRPFCEQTAIQPRFIHSSGHAGVDDLKRLAAAVNPARLIPIHTAQPDRFAALFGNVLQLRDGEVLCL